MAICTDYRPRPPLSAGNLHIRVADKLFPLRRTARPTILSRVVVQVGPFRAGGPRATRGRLATGRQPWHRSGTRTPRSRKRLCDCRVSSHQAYPCRARDGASARPPSLSHSPRLRRAPWLSLPGESERDRVTDAGPRCPRVASAAERRSPRATPIAPCARVA